MTVAVVALVTCLLAPRLASAQFDAATVLGSVIDGSGARRARRDRHAEERRHRHHRDDRQRRRTANYQFLNVRIGTYTVRAELQGFSAASAETSPSRSTRASASI